jgi:hypothetical protein
VQYVAVAKSRRRVLGYLHAMGLDVHSYCDQRQFGTPLFHAIYHECADVIRESTKPTGYNQKAEVSSKLIVPQQVTCTSWAWTWRRRVTASDTHPRRP